MSIDQVSQLIPDGYPAISKVVPASKYLQVESIGYQLFDVLINLGGFLRLTSPVGKNHIRCDVFIMRRIAFDSYQACLFGMLKVVSVTLGDLPVDCFLDPVDRVDHLVAPVLLHYVDCPLKFGIDDPDEQKPFLLQSRNRYGRDLLVAQSRVLYGDSSRRLRRR